MRAPKNMRLGVRHLSVVAVLSIMLAACAAAGPKVTAEAQETGSAETTQKAEATAVDRSVKAEKTQDADKLEGDDMENDMTLTIGKATFTVALEESETTTAFKKLLPTELDMSELNGNEKYRYLDVILPAKAVRPGRIEAGDIMLYGNNCLVVFYESFDTPYSYTRIGKITDAQGLKDALGTGSAKVRFELK